MNRLSYWTVIKLITTTTNIAMLSAEISTDYESSISAFTEAFPQNLSPLISTCLLNYSKLTELFSNEVYNSSRQ